MASSEEWKRMVRRLTEETAEERAKLEAEVNATPCTLEELQRKYGQVWTVEQVEAQFEIEAFCPPLACATRRADGVRGTLVYQHCPRYYWSWEAVAC